jgi:hypothetical protein
MAWLPELAAVTPSRWHCLLALLVAGLVAQAAAAGAQETPYFVTYDDQMEEPGNLEVELKPVYGTQRGGGAFLATPLEFELGVRAWWTSELYLDGQTTRGDSSVATGWRWENRFRLLMHEHRVNPVLYVEYEDTSAADKTLLEVVGHDVAADHAVPNRLAGRDHQHELETKLILASHVGAWNVAENLIAEKDLAGPPWELGYALGISRPLVLAASPEPCTWCGENFAVGLEMYGGLGDATSFGLRNTSHYLGPLAVWNLPGGTTLKLSPNFGLNGDSHRFLLRFGVSYELEGATDRLLHGPAGEGR